MSRKKASRTEGEGQESEVSAVELCGFDAGVASPGFTGLLTWKDSRARLHLRTSKKNRQRSFGGLCGGVPSEAAPSGIDAPTISQAKNEAYEFAGNETEKGREVSSVETVRVEAKGK